MSKKNKKKQNRVRFNTPLAGHQRDRKKLTPPWISTKVPLEMVHWHEDRLPEFLWVSWILSNHGITKFHLVMDHLDKYVDTKTGFQIGTLSSLNLVPLENREAVINEASEDLRRLFAQWTHIGKLYPEMPGNWLFQSGILPTETISLEESMAILKGIVLDLFDGRDSSANLARAAALSRFVKSGKLKIFEGSDIPNSLEGYPQTDKDQRSKAESYIRASTNALLGLREEMGEWAKYFWRQNFSISICEWPEAPSVPLEESSTIPVGDLFASGLTFERDQRVELNRMAQNVSIDLYDPSRHEILLGLLARQFRIVAHLATDVSAWSGDIVSYLARAMFENLLTVKYLEGHKAEYAKFVEYGLGQLKLYKLHLQDIEESQGATDEHLSGYIDYLEAVLSTEQWEETITVDLSSWSGKSLWDMAGDVDMKESYNLIYQPYSMDVHGTWPSLIKWNLNRCRNPLHKFHYIPNFRRPFFGASAIAVPLDLFEESLSYVAEAFDSGAMAETLLEPLGVFRNSLVEQS